MPNLFSSLLFFVLTFGLVTANAQTQQVDIMEESELQFLEAFTAPGSIFHGSLCNPPVNSQDGCTQLPLNYNKPFTEFPVVLRFYDAADAASAAQHRIESRRDFHDKISVAQFFCWMPIMVYCSLTLVVMQAIHP